MTDKPKRVDPPSCGCDDCWSGYSVPLDRADWQTVKAMLNGDVEDATSTELSVMVTVVPKHQLAWSDRQTWAWEYDAAEITADYDRRQFQARMDRIIAAKAERAASEETCPGGC